MMEQFDWLKKEFQELLDGLDIEVLGAKWFPQVDSVEVDAIVGLEKCDVRLSPEHDQQERRLSIVTPIGFRKRVKPGGTLFHRRQTSLGWLTYEIIQRIEFDNTDSRIEFSERTALSGSQ